ncbi:uncharacterized protein EV422DRAFT_159892 [Fimicolochytrium jonesii]|uniref:uncharacterized protein n=1 Tax=Fimicolochytrium jonesii TaxID=1396493 RepID=UPI0022FDDAC3|nr:uncharacterized protein EV422DRAFT_159892 [Fimicolochytrium jonesii]KAI8826253.1 hypothetical protein EV422DRAFT_159892 [Fimicolochytrium jonesii]
MRMRRGGNLRPPDEAPLDIGERKTRMDPNRPRSAPVHLSESLLPRLCPVPWSWPPASPPRVLPPASPRHQKGDYRVHIPVELFRVYFTGCLAPRTVTSSKGILLSTHPLSVGFCFPSPPSRVWSTKTPYPDHENERKKGTTKGSEMNALRGGGRNVDGPRTKDYGGRGRKDGTTKGKEGETSDSSRPPQDLADGSMSDGLQEV